MAAAPIGLTGENADAERRIAWAILASLIAHALLLLLLPQWLDFSQRKAVTRPLAARLVQQKPRPEPVVEPQARPELRREPPPKPVPETRPQPKLVAPTTAAPLPSVLAPVAPPVAEIPKMPEVPQAAMQAVPQAPAAKAEPAPPPSVPVAGESMDPATLGQYRIAIISAAKRYKRYPRLAVDNNWEGQAEIRMVIGADGSIASISIKSRSGFEVLDQQAIEMIRKAKPLTPIPPALRGRGFTIDVPVVFSLKEETG